MRSDIQCCAEFLRLLGPEDEAVTAFYRDVVGLPVMRSYPGIQMLWCGEDIAFELKYDTPDVPEPDPRTAALSCASAGKITSALFVPVLRTYDLDATRARLVAAGFPPVLDEAGEHGRAIYVVGPDGRPTGFQFRDAGSPLAVDAEALRRWEAGEQGLPNTGPMAPELQDLSRIVLHASDVARSSAFYAGALGLDDVVDEGDARLHSLGDTTLLQISPGGAERPVPADRFEAASAFLLRCHDLAGLTRDALAAGARPVGEEIVYVTGPGVDVRIRYLADPDGAVVGLIQRTDDGGGEEDVEAMRRWAARASSGAARA